MLSGRRRYGNRSCRWATGLNCGTGPLKAGAVVSGKNFQSMFPVLKKLVWYGQTFRAMSADQRRQALRRLRPLRRLEGLRNRIGEHFVSVLDRRFGASTANQIYWRLFSSQSLWQNTETRLLNLAANDPDALKDFVERGFTKSLDPMLLDRLSWNYHSRPILAQILARSELMEDEGFAGKVRKSRRYAAVVLASAVRLLDEKDARRIAGLVGRIQTAPLEDFFRLLDSSGSRLACPPTDPDVRGLLDSGFRSSCRHRLIISEDHQYPELLVPLFHGAEKVTLIALNDTFGRADFSVFPATQHLAELVVENIRSRVTRFSAAYIANHVDTRDVARMVTARLADFAGLLQPQEAGALEVAIADFLHFQTLKIRAVKELLADVKFDHIVITTEKHDAGSSYIRSLAAVSGLAKDPRIEVVSVSPSMDQRSRFDQCIYGLLNPITTVPSALDWALPLRQVLGDLSIAAEAFSHTLPDTTHDQVLVFASQNAAYDASTASYAAAIAAEHPVQILHAGLNTIPLQIQLAEQGADIPVVPFPIHFKKASRLNRWLNQVLLDVHSKLPPSPAGDALRIHLNRIAEEVIHSQLILARGIDIWFSRMKSAADLAKLVVVAPQRAPQILLVLPVARAHGVPTLALEAHGLNANYCRYVNIQADYYGVISDLFRQSAEADFRVPTDRTITIGTPRIIAPVNHDPIKARKKAREYLTSEGVVSFEGWAGTVSFFSQPSAWDHMAKVVGSILETARRLNLQVLLKPHPEETPSRIAAYQALAESLGSEGRMRIVQLPPNTLIEASDVVLTAYSAAALDAAILQVPVICVTHGDVRYPVDQHSIIGAPLIEDVDTLTHALRQLCTEQGAAGVQVAGFFQREPQFTTGPAEPLRALVRQILQTPPQDRLRPEETLPASFFLAEPHPVFPV